MARLQTHDFGPFGKGIIDDMNTSLDGSGYLASAKHLFYQGGVVLKAGPGSEVAITLMDDAGTPAECTSVCEVVQWADGVLAVAHSTTTDEAYLYWLDADLTGWYNTSGGFTAATEATPLGVLWSAMTASPVVHVAEMLGTAFVTCVNSADSDSLNFATKLWNGSTIATYTGDLDGAGGAEDIYALGCFSFQAHSWFWGMGSGTTAANVYRPELLRAGGPNGAGIAATGSTSLSIGHRVRSKREKIVGACVVDQVAYVGTSYSVWAIRGYGIDTWEKTSLDESFGFAGPKVACNANGVLYYWSPRGPMRVAGLGRPEPLWDSVPATVLDVVDVEKMICAFDPSSDLVKWFYRGSGVSANQLVCAFDVRRDVFLGPATDVGILAGAANFIAPVQGADASASTGPAGDPTTAVTSSVYATTATASWTTGDATASTQVQVKAQAGSTWTDVATVPPGTNSCQIAGLSGAVAYEWRCRHAKLGLYSGYLGPVAGSQFTTSSTLSPPTSLTLTDVGPALSRQGLVAWVNSGETYVETEVYIDDVYQGKAGVDEGTYYVTVPATASYAVKVRHIESGYTASAYAGPTSATLTYGEPL